MKTLLSGLLIFSFLHLFSQDSCVVKIFPNDCLTCYIGMTYIESMDSHFKKTMVFPNLSKAEINAYVKKVLNIGDINQYHVIASDSIYNSLNQNITSEVYLYNGDQLYEHYLLKTFCGLESTEPFEIKIPDSIAFSTAATLINNKDYFFISDSKFGNYIFISKYGENKVSVTTAQDLTTASNFYKISGDTLCYYMFSKYREVLKSASMDKMRLATTFITGNEMASCIMAPNINVVNDEAGLTYISGIIIFNSPNDYILLGIDEKSLPENYFIYPGSFTEYKGSYYIQIIHIDRELDDQYVFGKFVLGDGQLVFSEFCDYKIPPEYLPSSNFVGLRKVLNFVNPYAFLQYSLSFYDVDNEQTYQLPLDSVNLVFNFQNKVINSMKMESNYSYGDAYVSEKTMQILYKSSDNYYIATIDRDNKQLIEKKMIANPLKKVKTGMSFYSSDALFYLAKDNTVVVEKINYER